MSEHIGEHVKAVLFDFDDTLVETIGPKWAEHKFIAERYYAKTLTDEEIAYHWGKPLHELVCVLYGTDDADRALGYTLAHRDEYPKKLLDGAIPTLRRLRGRGIMTGVVTATSRRSLTHDLEIWRDLANLINYTQTADDTPWHKPDPRVFAPAVQWLREYEIKPNEVVYVGDGLHDMKAALGAGFSFVGVETGLVTAAQFYAAQATSIPGLHLLI